ncbi:DNA polymerase III subunit delta [Methylobacillus sp. MM3]|uniref:DNA polymerase III subunit delta n=1 Tax=Methylobacillus sp. MM3 TaxID=1848039 RepID=UPI0007E19A4A|nr:DNA polymerase III subunit delta [Methylobacillus sp. MM3]OAJ71337.1 DNA polymerase III subunit delta [Methylobacillus sp. MM3]
MHLSFDQLSAHLERDLRPLYILTGDEPLALKEGVDAIRQAARSQGYDERLSYTAERYFDWKQLKASSQSISLFASRRLLELHIPSGKPGVEGSKALQEFAVNLPGDTVALMTLPKLDKAGQGSAWFSALEKVGVVVPLQTVEIERLPRWIGNRLQAQGQQVDEATLEFLANQVEGNLLAAHQEIQKLGLLYPVGPLDPEAVREAVLNVSRFDVFQLGDALLAGDPARTAKILQGLEAEGAQPLALLGVLAWLLRGVTRVKLAETRGENLANAMQQAKIWGDRQGQVKRMLARVSLRQLQAAMLKMAEIDKICKGIAPGKPWLELSRLCIGLARSGTRRPAARSH